MIWPSAWWLLWTVPSTANGVSGTASSVSYAKELQGPISEKPNDNSLVVLGQKVIIDNLTKIMFNGTAISIANLNTSDTVEVSGFSHCQWNSRHLYREEVSQ